MNFIQWIGHFHPAMTVFPIGLLLAAALAEFLHLITKSPWLEGAARYCVIVAAIGGVITAPLGWAFAIGHHHSWILEWHRWLGTIGAAWLLVLLVISEVSRKKGGGWRGIYLAGLFLAVPAVTAIGFLGGAMVYGLHEYDWPSSDAPASNAALSSAPTAQAVTSGQTAIVKMTDDMSFQPASLSITVGTTVKWENNSHDTHTVTAISKLASDPKDISLPAGAEPFDSGKVTPGASYSHTFTVPGTYKYVCLPHEPMGMLGQVDVKPAPN